MYKFGFISGKFYIFVQNLDDFSENFKKKGGGHFRSKKIVADFFGNFERKNEEFSEKEGGMGVTLISLQILVPLEKKRNIVFQNEGGG